MWSKMLNALGICQRVVKLGYVVDLFLNFSVLHSVLQSGWTSLQAHQQWRRVLSPHTLSRICCQLFYFIAILIIVRSLLKVVLIHLSVIARVNEHFF